MLTVAGSSFTYFIIQPPLEVPSDVPVPADMDLELDSHSPTEHGEPLEPVIEVDEQGADEPEPSQEPSAPPTRVPSRSGVRPPTPEPAAMDPYTASLYLDDLEFSNYIADLDFLAI